MYEKLFYETYDNCKIYKILGVPVVSCEQKGNKKITKILGVKISHKLADIVTIQFSSDLKNIECRFEDKRRYKKLAIFASFNKDGLILDYVIYYLKELKKVVDGIIFVTDNPIMSSEIEKIKDLVIYANCTRHEEYDFGSYKRGYMWALREGLLNDAEELVLCNDSCYGPVYPFKQMFDEMRAKKCDFWGMTGNEDAKLPYHLQSFFLVFNEAVFKHESFVRFFKRVKKQRFVWDVISNFEVGLTDYLLSLGFSCESYIKTPIQESIENCCRVGNLNPTIFPLSLIKKYKAPLIKVKALNGGFGSLLQEGTKDLLEFVCSKNRELYECMTVSFSVILPTYNRKFCIMRAIDSLLAQTYQNVELIIVDDGSSDGTEDLIKQNYFEQIDDGKIIYHKLLSNQGVCHARNIGIEMSKKEWIVYLDSDNVMYDNFLESFKNAIIDNPKRKVFYAQICCMSNKMVIGHDFNFANLCAENYIDMGVFVHNKSMINKYGNFDESLKRLVDWDLIIRYTRYETPIYLAHPLLLYDDSNLYKRISNSESCFQAKEQIGEKLRQYDKTA